MDVKTFKRHTMRLLLLWLQLHYCYSDHENAQGTINLSNDNDNNNNNNNININISNKKLEDNQQQRRPHIIFILADDLGFNDVGFHGSAQIPTPNIDALAYSGLILNRYYVNPICTPSRSALMTGKYPIHTGMQHTVLYGAEPRGLPLNEKLMPQYFNELGYSSHIAGKWHLGHYKREYTPMYRGFRSHVGFWTGHHDNFDHTAEESGAWGLDMRNGMDVAYDLHGQYTTDVVTDESLRVIAAHNTSTGPLFLYVAHSAVHSGNPPNPLVAPDDAVAKMSNIENYSRRKYAAMVTKLDESVGKIVQQLHQSNMLNNSIIIFSTDNGGPAEGFNLNHASNWPLRGVKNTLWEGGVRGAALLWYPKLNKPRRVSEQTMHIADWLPTLLDAIGGGHLLINMTTASIGIKLDGISIWDALTNDKVSPRNSILHNIDDIWGSAAVTVGDWKLIKGTNYKGAWDGWYGPAGVRDPKLYDTRQLFRSLAGRSIASNGNLMPSVAEIMLSRSNATVNCLVTTKVAYPQQGIACTALVTPCLFNVREDPCERYNLAKFYPEILKALLNELRANNATAVPPSNKPLDPRANPRFWNYVWTNFGDYERSNNTAQLRK